MKRCKPDRAQAQSASGKGSGNGGGDRGRLPTVHSLQRTVGNRAVMQLLKERYGPSDQGRSPASAAPVIQRKLIEYVPQDIKPLAAADLDEAGLQELDGLIGNAQAAAVVIDGHVEEGRRQVQQTIDAVRGGTLELHDVAAQFPYSGHANNFQNKLIDYMTGQYSVHPSAPGGYLIEDYASSQVGNGIGVQVTPGNLRGSRPDFMIPLATDKSGPGGRDYDGLVDATARSDSSIGHILRKGGGAWVKRTAYPYVAESVYEPLSLGAADRQFTDDEIEAIKLRELGKQEASEKVKAAEIASLKAQYEDTVETLLALLNTGDQDAYLPKILKLSDSRTQSRLSLIGIDYDPKSNEIQGITSFEDWSSNAYKDFFGEVPGKAEKVKALAEIDDKLYTK